MVFFITGLYSRGKSHVLHLSVPTEHLLTFWNSMETMVDTQPQEVADDSDDTGVIPTQVQLNKESVEEGSQENVSGSDDDNAIARDNLEDISSISAQAINIASSIVGSCLAQLCEWIVLIKFQYLYQSIPCI